LGSGHEGIGLAEGGPKARVGTRTRHGIQDKGLEPLLRRKTQQQARKEKDTGVEEVWENDWVVVGGGRKRGRRVQEDDCITANPRETRRGNRGGNWEFNGKRSN